MIKKIKKLFSKIKKSIIHLNSIISYVHKKCGKLCIVIFFDIIFCEFRYFMTCDEYKYFEFYLIDSKKRKTYLTNSNHDSKEKYLYNKKILSVINNKEKFYSKFKKELNRDVSNLNDLSYKQFEDIVLQNKKILCRSINNKFLNSFKLYDLSKFRGPGFLLEEIKKNKQFIVEKSFIQHKLLNNISEELITINVITLVVDKDINIVAATINFKNDNKLVRGFIDLKEGIIKGHLRYDNYEIFNEKIVNYEIPCLDEIITLVKKLALELDEIREVEWSFCVTNRGTIYLMDANLWSNTSFEQIPEYLNKNIGLLPYYKKRLSRMRKI